MSFTYQRFGFGSIDGVGLKDLPIVNTASFGTTAQYTALQTRIDLKVDQFTVLGSFGLTDRVDVSVLVPFSKVSLAASALGNVYVVSSAGTVSHAYGLNGEGVSLAGSATGLGDVIANLKVTTLKLERTSIAMGSEVRFPTGDATNYLGSGAYGVKPYVVFSHRGRITPNVNLGYQWNGASVLNLNTSTGVHESLPSSFLYSGGADFMVVKHFTLDAEFLGQEVISGPRLSLARPPAGSPTAIQNQSFVTTLTGRNYAMDNAGAGFKINPFKGLLISANALFKLDDPGLRSKVVPLAGISYRF